GAVGAGARAGEVMEIVVVDVDALRDLAARAADVDHVAERALVAELAAIDFRVVAGNREVGAVSGAREHVVREADVRGAGADLRLPRAVREDEPVDLHVGRIARHVEPVAPRKGDAAGGLGDDPDRRSGASLRADGDRRRGRVRAVPDEDDVAGPGGVDARLEGGERIDGSRRRRAGRRLSEHQQRGCEKAYHPRIMTRLWRCAACGRGFANRNQSHSCGPRYSLAHHFRGKPQAIRAIYREIVAAIRAIGPVRVLPEKTRIAFQVRMSFAQVTPRQAWL